MVGADPSEEEKQAGTGRQGEVDRQVRKDGRINNDNFQTADRQARGDE